MRVKGEFDVGDVGVARALVAAHPFATIVTQDLRATHMPCLVDDEADGLAILSHVACADPVAGSIDGPVLMIFEGVRGYVSASWYADDTIPTWNHLTLHVRGTPERLAESLPLLRRTVDHFEAPVDHPWSLDRLSDTADEMAAQVVAFRLPADWWHLEAKLSQDKPGEERERIVAGLEAPGPYENRPLASAMRRFAPPREQSLARLFPTPPEDDAA